MVEYIPKPLPTFAPIYSGFTGMIDVVNSVFNRITTMLASVPVIPNANGLFDQNGNWLTPTVSMLDVMIALFVFIMTYNVLLSLSGGSISGGLTSIYASRRNDRD